MRGHRPAFNGFWRSSFYNQHDCPLCIKGKSTATNIIHQILKSLVLIKATKLRSHVRYQLLVLYAFFGFSSLGDLNGYCHFVKGWHHFITRWGGSTFGTLNYPENGGVALLALCPPLSSPKNCSKPHLLEWSREEVARTLCRKTVKTLQCYSIALHLQVLEGEGGACVSEVRQLQVIKWSHILAICRHFTWSEYPFKTKHLYTYIG